MPQNNVPTVAANMELGKGQKVPTGSCEGVDSGERNDVLVADRVTDLGKLALECQRISN